ncbi:PRC-barrel domain-containing protein [Marinobacterium sp. YM272]|uniref:PRC-barrel domain-containing protein n=1 Tax=Marinobacterium sp. YM272 TaxID=3421654 RepID=UPI003D7F1A84
MKKVFHPLLLAGALLSSVAIPVWAGEGLDVNTQNLPGIQIVRVEKVSAAGTKILMPNLAENPQQTPGFLLAAPEALELYNQAPEDLKGEQLYGAEGKLLGKVSEIVSDRISGRIYAVVSRGGFLGFGASSYAVPLDNLRRGEGAMHADMTASQFEMSKEFTTDRYIRVQPESHPISEFSAFETSFN